MGQSVSSQPVEERFYLQNVKLGQGAFGTVWRAIDRKTDQMVAVKQLDKAHLMKKRCGRSNVDREVKLMRVWRHENIAELYDAFEDDKSIFLALEYCDGGDFRDKIRERGMNLSEGDASSWIAQMIEAIAALHSKCICHRDIKPENFMVKRVNSSNRRFLIKLSDFGLAIYCPRDAIITDVCGTPVYMAPELHLLAQKRAVGYSFPVDVWAMGVSMYVVMLGGRHPFLTEDGEVYMKGLLEGSLDFREDTSTGILGLGLDIIGVGLRYSEEARAICEHMVHPDPRRRLNAADARGAILAWRSSVCVPPERARSKRPSSRHPRGGA